ncbi:hypothetical protein [Agitococcus lubricus]|nr:hypothetical protein [Agitococcus lubricus]
MTTLSDSILGLSLPTRDRKTLSLVHHHKDAMRQWVQSLPIMNAAESGKQLYQTITELSTLDIDEDLRFELLEIIQPTIHSLINTLEKHYQNQSLVLPKYGRRVYALTWALRKTLALNYKVVAIESLHKLQKKTGFLSWGRKNLLNLAASAIYRALTELRQLLLDSFRQYEDLPTGIWADIHKLSRVAQAQDLWDLELKVSATETSTIRQSYLRAVLLAASQPNKLRPVEITLIEKHSQQWQSLVSLSTDIQGSLLVCNLDDNPPLYHHRAITAYDSWYIQVSALVTDLEKQAQADSPVLPLSLLLHLIRVWRQPLQRDFERTACHKHILLCLGLSSAHYYAGGQTEFKTLVRGEEKKDEIEQPKFLFGLDDGEILEEQPDAWQICYGAVSAIDEEPEDTPMPEVPKMTYMPYRATAINRCPAGYGLLWPDQVPDLLRVGEIIGMSEQRGQGWGIGILHWLKQTAQQQVELGVELLAAQPKPCGVCLMKNGHVASEYMRGFLIPEMRILERPASIIVPNAGLVSGSTIGVSLNGQQVQMQLTHLLLATQSIYQFEFAIINTELPPVDDGLGNLDEVDVDDLWAKL